MALKNHRELKMNIGGASIILILVVLALSIFAVLSIKVSNHEWKLANKTVESAEAYYEADSEAEEKLRQIHQVSKISGADELLLELSSLEGIDTVEALEDGLLEVRYQVEVKEGTTLSAAVIINSDKTFDVTQWRIMQKEPEGYGIGFETENIWDGTVNEEWREEQ